MLTHDEFTPAMLKISEASGAYVTRSHNRTSIEVRFRPTSHTWLTYTLLQELAALAQTDQIDVAYDGGYYAGDEEQVLTFHY